MGIFRLLIVLIFLTLGGCEDDVTTRDDRSRDTDQRAQGAMPRRGLTVDADLAVGSGAVRWSGGLDGLPETPCGEIARAIVTGRVPGPELFHVQTGSGLSSGCLSQLTFWKFAHYVPSVDSKAELASELWRLARGGHEPSLAALALIADSGVFRLDSEFESQATRAAESRRASFAQYRSTALEARATGNLEAERLALIAMADLGSAEAASDLALLEINIVVAEAQRDSERLREQLRPLVAAVFDARESSDQLAEIAALNRLAEAGSATAAMDLAYRLTIQNGALSQEAVYWYERSIEGGEARAGWSLGAFLLRAFANSETVPTPDGELGGAALFERAVSALQLASSEGYVYPENLLSEVGNSRPASAGDIDEQLADTLQNAQPVGLVLTPDSALSVRPNAALELPTASIYWYRVASFLGEPRANWSLGAFLARSYVRGQAVEGPEGILEGDALIREAATNLAAAGTAGYSYPAQLAETILSAGILSGDSTESELLALLDAAQPIGFLVGDGTALPNGFSGHQVTSRYTQTAHVEEISPNAFRAEFHAVASSDDGNLLAISGYEIWEVGADVRVVAAEQYDIGTAWMRPAHCDNWFDASACSSDYLAFELDGNDLFRGQLFIRFIGEGGAAFAPVPIFRQPTASADTSRVAVIHPNYTWQAYNAAFGGSLYVNPRNEVYAVSLNRPIDARMAASHHNYRSSMAIARAYERLGLHVAHLTQEMISEQPDIMSAFDLIVTVGHDEYWDARLENGIIDYLSSGGRMLFLTGNTGWWSVDRSNGAIAVNKAPDPRSVSDPFSNGFDLALTGLDLADLGFRIEEITGSTYETGGYAMQYYLAAPDIESRQIPMDLVNRSDDLYVLDPDHPLFQGLNLRRGQPVCEDYTLVDHELDGLPIVSSFEQVEINWAWLPNANRSAQAIAGAYMFNINFPAWNARSHPGIVHFSGILLETTLGEGRVLTLGSMGAYALAGNSDPVCHEIGSRILTYLLD